MNEVDGLYCLHMISHITTVFFCCLSFLNKLMMIMSLHINIMLTLCCYYICSFIYFCLYVQYCFCTLHFCIALCISMFVLLYYLQQLASFDGPPGRHV